MDDHRDLGNQLSAAFRRVDNPGSPLRRSPHFYTDFKTQVSNKNVAELFARGDSIEGQLKKAVPIPGQQDRMYQQFTTERPTFANDDLFTELTEGGATRRNLKA